MKNSIILLLAFCTLFIVSCRKEESAKIVKDCTGTYLQIKGDDYFVCNSQKLDAYRDGTIIKAKYKKIRNCNTSGGFTCALYHPSEGVIEVLSIQ